MLVPLKVTTEYSLLKSLIKLDDLISFLSCNNISTCAICDDELFGTMEFYLKCKEHNIKPIIGLEVNIENTLIYLYATNYTGYLKMLEIHSKKETLVYKDIEDKNVLIVLPFKSIEAFDKFFAKENVYVAYKNSYEKASSMLLTNNVVYLKNARAIKKEDVRYLEYLKKLGGVFEYESFEFLDLDANMEDEKTTVDFASKINFELPLDKRYIPVYDKNIDSYKYLKTLALKGLEKRLGSIDAKYLNRLESELNGIKDMGFFDYFLIVYDYVLYAKKNGVLVGPGRGSAVGSLVSYSIGITDIDPIKYDLLFERFLNVSRQKMPDIDIDFADRNVVINYVKEKYGKDFVAVGITFNSLKSRLVLREIAKIEKVDATVFEKFIKKIDAQKSLRENLENNDVKKFLEYYPYLQKVVDISLRLENLKKNISTHAAGVVICSENLSKLIPLYKDENINKTGYAMEYLEILGILKMDFLGLKNLKTIASIIKKIPNFNIKNIDLDDKNTFEIFQNADTDYIFQFESSYAKNSLKKLNVKSFEELINAVALVRPGPNKQLESYTQNKDAKTYEVPTCLKDILKSTYGIIIFQEQVMSIFTKIGGFSAVEADNIRVALSKKKEEIINNAQKKFIINASKYGKDFAKDLFNKIKKFGEYGFNKSHSVSYALISYQLAYLKKNYPLEFYVTILQDAKDLGEKRKIFNILRQKGITMLKPNINVSSNYFQYKNKRLLLPFDMIKTLNTSLISKILERRKNGFANVFDFILRCYDIIDDKSYYFLVTSGLIDCFKINKKTLLENKEKLFNYAELGDLDAEKPILEVTQEFNQDTLLKMEIENYGFYVSNHPSAKFLGAVKIKDLDKYLFKACEIYVVIDKIMKIKTKDGKDMAFLQASDETGCVDVTVFPNEYASFDIQAGLLVCLYGKMTKRYDKCQFVVNKIKKVEDK